METPTGKFRNERGDIERATSRTFKIMNTIFQKKAGRRWTWKSQNGVAQTENVYIQKNRPDIVTDVTVINQVNIGSNHRMVMSNIKAGRRGGKEPIYDKEVTKNRYGTNRNEEDRIPTRIVKTFRDTTRNRRHRHHE